MLPTRTPNFNGSINIRMTFHVDIRKAEIMRTKEVTHHNALHSDKHTYALSCILVPHLFECHKVKKKKKHERSGCVRLLTY